MRYRSILLLQRPAAVKDAGQDPWDHSGVSITRDRRYLPLPGFAKRPWAGSSGNMPGGGSWSPTS